MIDRCTGEQRWREEILIDGYWIVQAPFLDSKFDDAVDVNKRHQQIKLPISLNRVPPNFELHSKKRARYCVYLSLLMP